MKCLIVAIVTVLCFGACTGDEAQPTATVSGANTPATWAPAPPTPTPQSNLLPDERDTHAVIGALEAANPGLAEFVNVVEGRQIDVLLDSLPQDERVCEAEIYRGTDGCQTFNVQPGTVLEFVHFGGGSAGRILRSMAEEQLERDFPSTGPVLELVGRVHTGGFVLIFDLGEGQFRVHYDPEAGKVTMVESRSSVMPLDFIRVVEAGGADVYEVLAAADSFHAKEAAFIEDSLANQTALPYDYPWWRPAGFPLP
jgi:hypothetical protein